MLYICCVSSPSIWFKSYYIVVNTFTFALICIWIFTIGIKVLILTMFTTNRISINIIYDFFFGVVWKWHFITTLCRKLIFYVKSLICKFLIFQLIDSNITIINPTKQEISICHSVWNIIRPPMKFR